MGSAILHWGCGEQGLREAAGPGVAEPSWALRRGGARAAVPLAPCMGAEGVVPLGGGGTPAWAP